MKPLSDEQKEKMWTEIEKLSGRMDYIHPGEKTVAMFAKERNTSLKRARAILKKLEEAGVLASRQAYWIAGKPMVFYPIQDISYEDISMKLKEIEGTA